MIASACGPNERYIGIYMVEGDPSYTIELHTETNDPKVIEELDRLNTEQFERGQTPLRILWRFLDPASRPGCASPARCTKRGEWSVVRTQWAVIRRPSSVIGSFITASCPLLRTPGLTRRMTG